MNELFSFCDDHFKIFILIWLKLREYYLESKNKSLSLPFVVKKTSNFLKNIRKQCTNIPRFNKIAKLVYILELELVESERFIEKLQHLALIADIFELPAPIQNIIKQIGLDETNDLENNDFSKNINNLFKNIDDVDLEKKINIIDENIQEGTLVNFLKNKKKDEQPKDIKDIKDTKNTKNNKKINEIVTESPTYNFIPTLPVTNYHLRNTSISGIPRYNTFYPTPNPRTQFRRH